MAAIFSQPQCVSQLAHLSVSELNHHLFMKLHDDVIKWKHFPRNWPFVRGIHRSPVNYPHKGQWRGALMFSLICVWISGWVNNREAGDLRRYLAHYDVIVMAPHHDQKQYWLLFGWIHSKKYQTLTQNTLSIIQENALENYVWKNAGLCV